MPTVYVFFDPDHSPAALLRVWARSWAARGWTPRILTRRNVPEACANPDWHDLPRLAFESVGRGKSVLADISVINFGLRPRDVNKLHCASIRYLHEGWKDASLVDFDNVHDPEVITHCGRRL